MSKIEKKSMKNSSKINREGELYQLCLGFINNSPRYNGKYNGAKILEKDISYLADKIYYNLLDQLYEMIETQESLVAPGVKEGEITNKDVPFSTQIKKRPIKKSTGEECIPQRRKNNKPIPFSRLKNKKFPLEEALMELKIRRMFWLKRKLYRLKYSKRSLREIFCSYVFLSNAERKERIKQEAMDEKEYEEMYRKRHEAQVERKKIIDKNRIKLDM